MYYRVSYSRILSALIARLASFLVITVFYFFLLLQQSLALIESLAFILFYHFSIKHYRLITIWTIQILSKYNNFNIVICNEASPVASWVSLSIFHLVATFQTVKKLFEWNSAGEMHFCEFHQIHYILWPTTHVIWRQENILL